MMKPFTAILNKIFFLFICIVLLSVSGCENNTSEKPAAQNDIAATSSTVTDTTLSQLRLCTELPMIGEDGLTGDGKQASALKFLLWPSNKKVLNVRFIDGDSIVKSKVKEVSKEWEQYCSIRFEYIDTGAADITISFKQGGSWSYIGKSSAKHIPSMNLGWLTPTTPLTEYYRVVLHEFGHALGLIHEHQNPAGNVIHWDSNAVYKYYQQAPNFWTKENINKNLFEKYKQESMNGTAFDSLSIMLYAFPKELTTDGYATTFNSQLSAMDKKLINILYPK